MSFDQNPRDDEPQEQPTATPGPWEVYQLADDEDTYGVDAGKWIVTADKHRNEVCGVIQTIEDARLIAASRELLAACQAALASLDDIPDHGYPDGYHFSDCPHCAAETQLKAAIAKATGKDT